MADCFELSLAFDLVPDTPPALLTELRRQLDAAPEAVDEDLLLAGRGPARRCGGVLHGALAARDDGGWALAARQEVHPDRLADLQALLDSVLPHLTPQIQHVGQLRWYEELAPVLLVPHQGRVVEVVTVLDDLDEAEPISPAP